jgi:hypothetical protein
MKKMYLAYRQEEWCERKHPMALRPVIRSDPPVSPLLFDFGPIHNTYPDDPYLLLQAIHVNDK